MRRAGLFFILSIGVLELVLLLAIGFSTPFLVSEWRSRIGQPSSTPPANKDSSLEDLKEREASTDKEVTHLEQSVVIMLGFSALTLAILFGSIAFGEYRINRAVEDLEDRANEVKERYPLLAAFEETLRSALDDYEETFHEDDWVEDRYSKMTIEVRQHILTAEHFLALQNANATALQLRGMANFYFSKYNAEKLASDLDRALYYADLASKKSNGGYQYKNDLGFIYMDLASRGLEYRIKAERALLESKRKNPSQQRCYYNLGLIYYQEGMDAVRDRDSEQAAKACDVLRTALKQQNWESKPNAKVASAVNYNLACCLSRLAEIDAITPQVHSSVFDQIVGHLEHAAKFKQTKLGTLIHDLDDADGDLSYFASNRSYAHKVKMIRASFEAAWNT